MSTNPRGVDGEKTAEAEPGAPPPVHVPSFLPGRRGRDESFGLPAGQVAGFAVLFAAFLVALVLVPGKIELIFAVLMTAVGARKLVADQLAARDNDELPPASRAFRELADPARPLTADDPVTTTLAAGPDAASPGRRPADAGSDAAFG
jgi:hypothetical protein